jgi:hypothetical protein
MKLEFYHAAEEYHNSRIEPANSTKRAVPVRCIAFTGIERKAGLAEMLIDRQGGIFQSAIPQRIEESLELLPAVEKT